MKAVYYALKTCATAGFYLAACSVAMANTCPNWTDSQNTPEGWSQASLSAPKLPASFEQARYLSGMGTLKGTVICDYNDAKGQMVSLISQNKYPDPNPSEDVNSPWLAQRYPFKHLLCLGQQAACAF